MYRIQLFKFTSVIVLSGRNQNGRPSANDRNHHDGKPRSGLNKSSAEHSQRQAVEAGEQTDIVQDIG